MVAGTYAMEVELGVPIHRMWKVARKIDVVAPKLMPDLFGGSELLEGDGGTGTVRVITLGPAFPVKGEVKERVDSFDDATTTIKYTVLQGDPTYKSMKASMKYTPSEDGTKTTARWEAVYDTVGEEDQPPVENSKIAKLIQTTFAKFLTENPTEFA